MKDENDKLRIHVIIIGAMGATQQIVNMYAKLIIREYVESASSLYAFSLDL